MKQRIIVGILVLAGIGLIAAYIARNTYWEETYVPAPLRGEAATNPFYAAQKFAEALGATTEWQRTLGTLPDDAVLVLSRWYWDAIETRRQTIERWVENGGRLVVDGSLIANKNTFARWSGVARERFDEESDEESTEQQRYEEEPLEEDQSILPMLRSSKGGLCTQLAAVDADGIERVDGKSLDVCTLDESSFLDTDRAVLWGYADDKGLQAVRVAVGRGTVTVMSMTPFDNRDLADVDHGKLFVEATNLRRGDHVIFLTEYEHMPLLVLMWLYGAPVIVLAALAIATFLWRGSVRFGPLAAPQEKARRSLAEQIRGTGQFTVRLGGGKALHAATVRALHEAASRRIARYASLSDEQRIEAIAQVADIAPRALQEALAPGTPRRKGELAHAIVLLERTRRTLARGHTRS